MVEICGILDGNYRAFRFTGAGLYGRLDELRTHQRISFNLDGFTLCYPEPD